jgi:hypothetical protein
MPRDRDYNDVSDVDSNRRSKRQRTRSRSPRPDRHTSERKSHHGADRRDRVRSRSPRRHEKHSRSEHRRHNEPSTAAAAVPPKPIVLPMKARPLDQHDSFKDYKALFALYLDVHKQLDVDELEEREVKGRWKSFVKKWYVQNEVCDCI